MMNCSHSCQKWLLLIMIFPTAFIYITFTCCQIMQGYYNSENMRGYLVYSNSCKIPNISPFNWETLTYFEKNLYVPCRQLDLLTYITKNKENTAAVLHIDENVLSTYSSNGVRCCLRTITRINPDRNETENKILTSSCKYFYKRIVLPGPIVTVECRRMNSNQTVYYNVHTTILLTEDIKRRQRIHSKLNQSLSVVIIGIDSISRPNMIRTMPHTYKYLKDNNWIEMQGYNKVGSNTLPNLMAFLTGKNFSAVQKCSKEYTNYPNCNFIWDLYKRFGYATAYAEDNSYLSTFNYLQNGFVDKPVDYYLRPYYLATDIYTTPKRLDDSLYCSGMVSNLERTLGIAEDFAITFKGRPSFGLFWTNVAHSSLNAPTRYDLKFKQFFQRLIQQGILDTTIVIFLSDHGTRFGDILKTYSGWLETRLPMFFMWIPHSFRMQNPEAYKNILLNANILTNPYDLYMTLQDILFYSGYNVTIKQADACQNCNSLFKYMDNERSCIDINIDKYWCTCDDYKYISIESSIAQEVKKCSLQEIHRLIKIHKDGHKCARYSIHRTLSARASENKIYVMVVYQTAPYTIFEVMVKLDAASQRCTNDISISRLSRSGPVTQCIQNKTLELVCYCL